jgi:hypothetical protein
MTEALQRNRAGVAIFGVMMRFAAWLQNLPNRVTPPPFRIIQISASFWQSRALYVAARLDIASVIGDRAMAADDVAARVGTHPDATWRLLRMLAAMGIFTETGMRMFANNALSFWLREDNPRNVRAMVLMHNSAEMSMPWQLHLEQGIRSGSVPFECTHGREFYDLMDADSEFDALFARAMDSVEALAGDSFATDFDWARFTRVIDVGGSRGGKSVVLLRQHPHLTATVFDRPQTIRGAQEYWAAREPALAQRLHFIGGDLFRSVPQAAKSGDAYLLSAVLHGFDDEACVVALTNLAQACAGTDAHLVMMEMVVPDRHADYTSAAFDMQMFMATRGRERTRSEWKSLFARSGLRLKEEVGLRSIGHMLVLVPVGG